MTSHALLSPSGAHRWLRCTPSARLEASLPEPKKKPGQKDFSAEGTLAHSMAEIKLKYQLDQIGLEEHDKEIELCKNHPLYSEELEEVANTYTNYVRSQIGQEDKVFVEARVDIGEYVVESFGTADCIIISKNKITVIDLKGGAGVPVSAVNNEQLRMYALGAYERYKDEFTELKEVRTIIVQPRLDSITEDHTTITKLVEWGRYYVKKRAQKAYTGSGDYVPGDHCHWCRAKAQCRARSDYNTELAKQEFKAPALLTEEEVSEVLVKAQNLKTWVNDVEEFALTRAVEQDIVPPGFKLGTTITHRKISDSQLAATVLVEKGMDPAVIWEPPKLKSISVLEKLGPKGQVVSWLGDLVQKPAGSPKLVKSKEVDAKEDFA
jgi:hypothetical protein